MKKIQLKGELTVILTIIIILCLVTTNVSSISYTPKMNNDEIIEPMPISSQSQQINDVLDLITEDLIEEFLIKIVGYGPRYTGTYGCEKSAEYMWNQYKEMGLDARFQNWKSFGNRYNPLFFNSNNVEGTLHGSNTSSDTVITFGAHYDTVRVSPGANDDGSGTVAVLAAAYALSHFDFEHTVKFVTFSGEEIGLLGSQVYAQEAYHNKENILVYFNADMIGHATQADTGRMLRVPATEDATWIYDILDYINTDFDFNFDLDRGTINRDAERGYGDYFPFIQYGFECISFWEGEGDPNMHTPQDTIDNVNISYLVNTTRIIVGALAYLADTYDTHPQVQIESPQMENLYFKGFKRRNLSDLKTIVFDDIWIWADVKFASVPITHAEFYYDDKLEYVDDEPPYKWNFNKFSLREHRIKVIVYDELGRNSTYWRDIRFINPFPRR